jgi:hypothetical protein
VEYVAVRNGRAYCAVVRSPDGGGGSSVARVRRSRRRPYFWRLLLVCACAVVLAVVLGGLLPDRQARPGAAGPPAAAARDASAGLLAPWHPAGVAASAPSESSPTEASLRLESLLGQHSVLAADMMRGRLRDDPDLAQAANAALGKNTEALGQLVQALFGEQAKSQFTQLWAGHVTALFNYARGLAEQDDAVRTQANAAIVRFESNLATFFSVASQGRLPRSAAEAAVRTHIAHLLDQAEAYAAKDYARSDRIYREAYTHGYGLGKVLAATLLPPTAAASLDTPTWRLRSELGRLLGEHVVLVVAATRAGVTNAADFATAAQTVDANTGDLAGAMGTLFGQTAGHRFQSLWADHIDALMAYSAAVVKQDDAQRTAAEQKLATFERGLSAFLASATRTRVAPAALADALQMHDRMLVQDADAFAAKNYAQAHEIAYTMYDQMFDLSRTLSSAFGATVAARLPVGGVQTGGGGMATAVEQQSHGG